VTCVLQAGPLVKRIENEDSNQKRSTWVGTREGNPLSAVRIFNHRPHPSINHHHPEKKKEETLPLSLPFSSHHWVQTAEKAPRSSVRYELPHHAPITVRSMDFPPPLSPALSAVCCSTGNNAHRLTAPSCHVREKLNRTNRMRCE